MASPTTPPAPVGVTGSSPSHRPEAPSPALRAGLGLDATSAVGPADKKCVATPVHELSIADSFIMEVLGGWRLLQVAGLNAEEKPDILSTTKKYRTSGTTSCLGSAMVAPPPTRTSRSTRTSPTTSLVTMTSFVRLSRLNVLQSPWP